MNEREYRSFELIQRDASEGNEYIVEGYASTFEPYVLYVDDAGNEIKERVSENAFDEADFSDCVFRVDHTGAVYARVSAGTVKCDIDEKGLHNITDLGRTQKGRDLYEDIKAGNYPQMSFAFTVEKDSFDKRSLTRTIERVGKVYDISPVTWPANNTTSLSARSKEFIDGVIKELEAERLLEERKAAALERIEKLIKKGIPADDN